MVRDPFLDPVRTGHLEPFRVPSVQVPRMTDTYYYWIQTCTPWARIYSHPINSVGLAKTSLVILLILTSSVN